MKLILVTCLFVALAASLSIPLENLQLDLENEWAAFKEKFARTYNDFKDEANRKAIFADKLKEIKLHNYKYSLGLTTFTLGVNSLSDMSVEEISVLNGYKADPKQKITGEMHKESKLAAPASVDWRKSGYVTPVKNQGSCGSCWAFSSTGALEAQMFKKTGKLVPLSEQNLVDCSRPHGNQGCSGGWMHYAFNYIRTNGGMNSGSFYPYEGREYTCRYNKNYIAATVYTHVNIQQYNEKQLMEAVANVGPVSVAVDASLSTFNNYKSGVMYDSRCSQTNLSHAVLVVGYGTENGQDFWLVKNSWGTGWGDQGYIKMARNRNNHCGIASAAVYPQV